MENNFKFDMGEMFALAKINRDYTNKRFELLSKKNLHHTLENLSFATIKKNNNMKRGFLAGTFICCGIFSDPQKNYSLEFINSNLTDAKNLADILLSFAIDCKITERKNHFVNYIREAELLSKFLKLIGANISFMEFENVRIFKDLRNNINRNVNFETANLNKTIIAAVDSIIDINYIISTVGLDYLAGDLKKIAEYRLKNKQASLKELGEKFVPPLSKSNVHYKLKSISKIANELRNEKGDKK